jgi:hypothetical protein
VPAPAVEVAGQVHPGEHRLAGGHRDVRAGDGTAIPSSVPGAAERLTAAS